MNGSPVRSAIGHIVERSPVVVLLFVIFAMVGALASVGLDIANDLRASRVEREDVFEYVSIQYEGIDTEVDGLVMSSTRVFYRDVDGASFVDVLRCSGVIVSTYSSTVGAIEAGDLETQPWTYQGDFPVDGRPCRIDAEITVDYEGRLYRQRLDSIPFNPMQGDEAS